MHPLPATKLRPPRAAAAAVPRPRLEADLARSRRSGRATVVLAPAGYGKTTLAARWTTALPASSAWFSVDPGDDSGEGDGGEGGRGGEGAAADRRVASWLAAALLAAGALREPPDGAGVAALLTALERATWRGVVIVDDAHLLGADAAAALATWIERSPDGVHTVLLARQAPPLPLARWLARGEAEVMHAETLRMHANEGRELLARALPELPPELADALIARVEGWPAGLHLAARSLRGRSDPADLIERFTGTDRYVLAFLTEEVLLRLPDDLHEAALLLAGEPRLCPGLVDALTLRRDGASLLARLEAHEAFLERLDVHDGDAPWYRFPGFFRDLLAHRLDLARPDLESTLRERAASWWRRRRDAAAAASAGRGAATAAIGTDTGAEPGALAGIDLTLRERDVLALLVAGATTKAAARALDLSPNTVKTHTRHLFEKLGVSTRTAAAARARELGLA